MVVEDTADMKSLTKRELLSLQLRKDLQGVSQSDGRDGFSETENLRKEAQGCRVQGAASEERIFVNPACVRHRLLQYLCLQILPEETY